MHIPPFSSSNLLLIRELAVGVGAKQVHSDLWHHLLNIRKVNRKYTQESIKNTSWMKNYNHNYLAIFFKSILFIGHISFQLVSISFLKMYESLCQTTMIKPRLKQILQLSFFFNKNVTIVDRDRAPPQSTKGKFLHFKKKRILNLKALSMGSSSFDI